MSDKDEFYHGTYGYHFGKMSDDQRATADAWLKVVSLASAPDSYPGAANAKEILKMKGGLSSEQARQLSAYEAYKANALPMDEAELAKARIKLAPDKLEEYRKKWIDDHGNKFATLVTVDPDKAMKSDKEERAVEVQPIEAKSKAAPPAVAAPAPSEPSGVPASQPASAPASQPGPDAPMRPMNVGPSQPALAANTGNWTRKRLNPETGQYEDF